MRLLACERRWLLAILETVLPDDGSGRLPLGARAARLDRFADDLLAAAPPAMTWAVRAAIWFVQLAPRPVLGRGLVFTGLASKDRVALLERLSRSRLYALREIPGAFKALACLGYCGLPEVQRQLGMPADAEPPAWFAAEEPS